MECFVYCDICGERIAIVDQSEVRLPLSGSMFKSPDPFHGFDPPFQPGDTWEEMRCPYGPHRPFILENALQVQECLRGNRGTMMIDNVALESKHELPEGSITCDICGKEFNTSINLQRHKKLAHKGA